MAEQEYWTGTNGPFPYEDTDVYRTADETDPEDNPVADLETIRPIRDEAGCGLLGQMELNNAPGAAIETVRLCDLNDTLGAKTERVLSENTLLDWTAAPGAVTLFIPGVDSGAATDEYTISALILELTAISGSGNPPVISLEVNSPGDVMAQVTLLGFVTVDKIWTWRTGGLSTPIRTDSESIEVRLVTAATYATFVVTARLLGIKIGG